MTPTYSKKHWQTPKPEGRPSYTGANAALDVTVTTAKQRSIEFQ